MKNTKKLLILMLVSLLAFSLFAINASAYTEPASLVTADIDLEVGRYSGGVFTPLTPGEALVANEVITVRIAPTTDFLCGSSKYVVMFTKNYLQVVGAGTAAFTPNTANDYYAQSASGYSGQTVAFPLNNWPVSLRGSAYTENSTVSVTVNAAVTAPNGGYPNHIPGDWLFRFDLRVTQNITAGSGAKVWMDTSWFRSPSYPAGQAYFYKVLDSAAKSSTGSWSYNFVIDHSGANINLEPSTNVTITWNANGGTGGMTTSVANGAMPTPPAGIARTGYTLTGWSPAIVVATDPATYTAQWEIDPVAAGEIVATVTKNPTDLTVTIDNAVEGCKYQIWSYQAITSDLFDSVGKQWILSKEYDAIGQASGTLNYTIADFVSPDQNYTIAVRIIDAGGNFAAEIRDSYTPTEVGLPVITEVLVDGENAKGRNNAEGIFIGNGQFIAADLYENNFKGPEIREIKTGASVLIKVIGNAACTVYTATVAETMETLTANGNEFLWDISGLEPRTYNLIITAGDGSATDTVYMLFKLYKTSAAYGVLSALSTGTPVTGTPTQTISVTPGFAGGLFNYWVREEGRTPEFRSAQFASAGGIAYDFTKYGVYAVQGYVYRPGIAPLDSYDSFDDVAKVFVNIKRGAGSSSVDLNASSNPVVKGSPITLTASNAIIQGIGATPLQYSFWRYDADGYKLLKDWSSSNTLAWTPGRVGDYPIEVRVKGEDAGSYETRTSLLVTVTDGTDEKATVTNITAVVNGTATARIPVVISAKATASNGADLLFKFNVSDEMFGQRTVQNYSADQELVWTPREAGTYYIDVLVKSSDSFGIYDAKETITVTVN